MEPMKAEGKIFVSLRLVFFFFFSVNIARREVLKLFIYKSLAEENVFCIGQESHPGLLCIRRCITSEVSTPVAIISYPLLSVSISLYSHPNSELPNLHQAWDQATLRQDSGPARGKGLDPICLFRTSQSDSIRSVLFQSLGNRTIAFEILSPWIRQFRQLFLVIMVTFLVVMVHRLVFLKTPTK